MDNLKIVFECEYCFALLDSLTTSHNCPCNEAADILKAPSTSEFRSFLDHLPRRVIVIRGQREFDFLLEYFRNVLSSSL